MVLRQAIYIMVRSYYHTSDNPNQGQGYNLYPIDYNADGREDLIRFRDKTNTWELFLSTPQADGSWRLKKTRYKSYRLMA